MSMDTVATITSGLKLGYDLIQKISENQDRMKYVPEMKKNILDRIRTVKPTLDLVREKECLRTPHVEKSLERVTSTMGDLNQFSDEIGEDFTTSRGRFFRHFTNNHALRDRKLADLLGSLQSAMDNLHISISLVHVGIEGNNKEGFFVSSQTVAETNQDVHDTIRRDLYMMTVMDGKNPESNGLVQLTSNDQRAIEHYTGQKLHETAKLAEANGSIQVSNNNGSGDTWIMSGNLGMEADYKRSSRGNVVVTDNTWEGSSRIITGDIGGPNAVDLVRALWTK